MFIPFSYIHKPDSKSNKADSKFLIPSTLSKKIKILESCCCHAVMLRILAKATA